MHLLELKMCVSIRSENSGLRSAIAPARQIQFRNSCSPAASISSLVRPCHLA
jgi:hypothetical protein